jgi:hypothetical protein
VKPIRSADPVEEVKVGFGNPRRAPDFLRKGEADG